MKIPEQLLQRASQQCELCSATEQLQIFLVGPEDAQFDCEIVVCGFCHEQLSQQGTFDAKHWHCLKDSMWSQVPAVQVVAWRMLKQLSTESWAQDLLDMLYLDESLQTWAEAGLLQQNMDEVKTYDSNGTVLQAGDTVTLIKDLVVKGGGFTAKRGTSVKNISLTDNPEHVEGKVNGQQIVLVAKFLKKSA